LGEIGKNNTTISERYKEKIEMDYPRLIRWSGVLNITTSVLFLLWWVLMGIIVISSGNLEISTLELVRLNGYQLQSIIGLIACVIAPIAIMGLYLPNAKKVGKLGLIGSILSCVGITLYGCMQYDETFTWPVLAVKAPELLETGGLMSDTALLFIFIFMGIILALGIILLGIANWRAKVYPRWAVVLFTVGATLFAIGMAVMVRTIGIALWVIGWGWMGYLQWKEKVT
jgi:hypothetical protein